MTEYATKEKKKLLFVCLGNICRSPAAEEMMRQILEGDARLKNRFEVDSAGIGDWHEGQLPDYRMRQHGQRRGYNFHSRARQIKSEDFDRFDLIFGMDAGNMADLQSVARNDDDRKKLRRLADYMTQHPSYNKIPDPYYGGAEAFELALDLIEDACRGLAEKLLED